MVAHSLRLIRAGVMTPGVSDGRKISLPGSNGRQVRILDTQSGEKSGIEPKGWSNVLWTSWAPDNQQLYVSGLFGSRLRVALLSLDGRETVLLDADVGQGWPTALYPSPEALFRLWVATL